MTRGASLFSGTLPFRRVLGVQRGGEVLLGQHPVGEGQGLVRQAIAIEPERMLTDHAARQTRGERFRLRMGLKGLVLHGAPFVEVNRLDTE